MKGTKRCFSDGVGKLSQAMLDKIYEQSETIETKRPTVFQIRYGGAKGMVISCGPDEDRVVLTIDRFPSIPISKGFSYASAHP